MPPPTTKGVAKPTKPKTQSNLGSLPRLFNAATGLPRKEEPARVFAEAMLRSGEANCTKCGQPTAPGYHGWVNDVTFQFDCRSCGKTFTLASLKPQLAILARKHQPGAEVELAIDLLRPAASGGAVGPSAPSASVVTGKPKTTFSAAVSSGNATPALTTPPPMPPSLDGAPLYFQQFAEMMASQFAALHRASALRDEAISTLKSENEQLVRQLADLSKTVTDLKLRLNEPAVIDMATSVPIPESVETGRPLFPVEVARRKPDARQKLSAMMNGRAPKLRVMVTRLVVCKRVTMKKLREQLVEAGVGRHVVSDLTFVSDRLLCVTLDEEFEEGLVSFLESNSITVLPSGTNVFDDVAMKYITRNIDITDCLIERHQRAQSSTNPTKRDALMARVGRDITFALTRNPTCPVLLQYALSVAENKTRSPSDRELIEFLTTCPIEYTREDLRGAFEANEERKIYEITERLAAQQERRKKKQKSAGSADMEL